MYGLPGNVDYPFSIAYSLPLIYDPVPLTANNRTYFNVNFLNTGTRTYTNRFGETTSTLVGLSAGEVSLYSGGTPFADLRLTPALPVQAPGEGPLLPAVEFILESFLGVVIEEGLAESPAGGGFTFTTLLDPLGQVYASNIPGFVNTTIAASNINSLAADL